MGVYRDINTGWYVKNASMKKTIWVLLDLITWPTCIKNALFFFLNRLHLFLMSFVCNRLWRYRLQWKHTISYDKHTIPFKTAIIYNFRIVINFHTLVSSNIFFVHFESYKNEVCGLYEMLLKIPSPVIKICK